MTVLRTGYGEKRWRCCSRLALWLASCGYTYYGFAYGGHIPTMAVLAIGRGGGVVAAGLLCLYLLKPYGFAYCGHTYYGCTTSAK